MWRNPDFKLDFDGQVTLRLYRHQNYLLWAHKAPLRPATISLFDSDAYWGKWDPETRTIFISRKLVRDHPWFCVESILGHEMAHQYADEHFKSTSHGHDELFRKCCRLLGVPAEFSKASASLQEHTVDWKARKVEDTEAEKLLSKVQKLLALATSSNEHEALLAMEKVREIYARHNLSEHLRPESDGDRKPMVHLTICHKKKRFAAHQSKICGILVGHFFVKVLYVKNFDPATGDEYQAIQLIGTRENVLMAEYVYHFLLNQTEFLLKALKKKQGVLTRVEMKSYRLGILQGFQRKLSLSDDEHLRKHEKESHLPTANEPPSVGKALALLKSDKRLDDYMEATYPRMATRSSSRQYIAPDLYLAGQTEGERINLHRGVADQGGRTGRFLTHD